MEDEKNALPPSGEEKKPETKVEGEQDPLKVELEKVKTKRTHKEKLIFTKNRIEEQLRELEKEEGGEPSPEADDDDAPLTKGEFKKMQAQVATRTALELADDIESETERELTRYHINNTIKSTGNPKEDLKLARAIVNSAKNAKIAEEATRRTQPRRGSSTGGGAPYKEEELELTAQELKFTRPPWNLSKETILEKRKEQTVIRHDRADIEDQG